LTLVEIDSNLLTNPTAGAAAMEIRHVRYFLALCREGNFTRAAERCGIAQPSLTDAIKKLELELGGALYSRARHPLSASRPTRLALAIRPHLEQVHANVERARRVAEDYRCESAWNKDPVFGT